MFTLAEISDKVSLPMDPQGGAVTLASVALALAIILAVVLRRGRWLALVPSACVATIWYLDCTDRDFVSAIPLEFGVNYTQQLVSWMLGLHLPVVLLLICWPRRWSIRWPHSSGCRDCGYDLRGLPSTKCPECGTDSGTVKPA